MCLPWCNARKSDVIRRRHGWVIGWYDWIMCVIWLFHMCGVTHGCVWHDSFMCLPWCNMCASNITNARHLLRTRCTMAHMHESCHTHKGFMPHVRVSHITHPRKTSSWIHSHLQKNKYIHECIYTNAYIRMHAHTHANTEISIHTGWMRTHLHDNVYTRTNIDVCSCVFVCIVTCGDFCAGASTWPVRLGAALRRVVAGVFACI